ncbi:hypothetical protein GCM10017782_03270 [Deinococcus ficus]|nr:hypothetical protein GCM10017782_03270 [Deinococcus ficus]
MLEQLLAAGMRETPPASAQETFHRSPVTAQLGENAPLPLEHFPGCPGGQWTCIAALEWASLRLQVQKHSQHSDHRQQDENECLHEEILSERSP